MKVTLQKDVKLGAGGFATVYRATDLKTGNVVALKQSRVSHKIRRPLLEHEARVLKLLSGHPAIPQIYGYGRVEHYELLSMQILDKSLGDAVDAEGPLSVYKVLDIAIQLISALEHMHTRGLVHRDIKPDNILFQSQDSMKVCLIDFGLAYPAPTVSELQVTEFQPSETSEMRTVFGTLPYASLHAHKGLNLTYRDDMESLAYTLLFLLRGNLPWSHYTRHGTVQGRIRQVYAQKRRLGGSQLAAGVPNVFGDLVDHARSLSPNQLLDYREWRERFEKVVEDFDGDLPCTPPKASPGLHDSNLPPPAHAQLGQIVLIKLISSITAEGYSIQADHERSFVQDPRFEEPEWNCHPRPCIILEMEWDKWAKVYRLTTAPISNNQKLEEENLRVPIVNPNSYSYTQRRTVSINPDWPFERSYCYAFRRLSEFYAFPSQEQVASAWTVDQSGVDTIIKNLTPPRNSDPFASLRDSESSNPDVRYDAKMRTGYVKHYVQILPLTNDAITCQSVDWNSTRGWFDECVRASRHYDMCNGELWTDTSGTQSSEVSETSTSSSYCEEDFGEWETRRQLRDRSITLATVLRDNDRQVENLLNELYNIELAY